MNDPYFLKLKRAIKKSDKGYVMATIESAYEFSKSAHEGQFRLSGEPFISHPVEVAIILIELGMDTNAVVAGLLHDVVEDTKISGQLLEKNFGTSVAKIVEGVTKLEPAIIYKNSSDDVDDDIQQQQVENIRKMLLAMAKDVRVMIVKLADRLHNMETANGWPEQKRRDKALETMEIYAPLAQRLGITLIKEKLQDLSLRILDPIAYEEISRMLKSRQKSKSIGKSGLSYIKHLEQKAKDRLKNLVPSAQISGRLKSHYAIYFKVYVNGKDWDEVFDIYAIRIVVNTVVECYGVLGAMHNLFKPLQNRFKDYIATPKANFYQSLHTTVIDENGVAFEIQIRTKQMHYMAEYGIAAHWKYKQKIESSGQLEEKLSWVRRIIEMQRESETMEDFFHLFKIDLNSEEVFVFTPTGEVKSLPAGSSVVDFAYLIGSKVGNKMIGAKIDGKVVPIDSKIESNQVIEILTTNLKLYGPSRSWFSIAKTSAARNKIREWFKKERRNENVKRGMAEIKTEFSRNAIKLSRSKMKKFLEAVAKMNRFSTVNDFFAAVGYGAVNVQKIMAKTKKIYAQFEDGNARPNLQIKPIEISNKHSFRVVVEGIGSCVVSLAKCCNPIPGCKIVGYITKNKHISVHCVNCCNVKHIQNNVNRINRFVDVHFDENSNQVYFSMLKIVAISEGNVLNTVSSKIASLKIKINNLNADFLDDGNVQMKILISVFCCSQLKSLVEVLKKLKGIVSVSISTRF